MSGHAHLQSSISLSICVQECQSNPSINLADINNQAILQSDWVGAFWAKTQIQVNSKP